MEKYSAIGPKVRAGKKERAVMIKMTAKIISPKVVVSVFNVPALSGICFLPANKPAIANGPIIGINLPKISTMPVEIFHHWVLSPKPSKPEPLFAADEVNS